MLNINIKQTTKWVSTRSKCFRYKVKVVSLTPLIASIVFSRNQSFVNKLKIDNHALEWSKLDSNLKIDQRYRAGAGQYNFPKNNC